MFGETIDLSIGIAGMAILLSAFIMNELGKWHVNSRIYDFANFFGAFLLTVYALALGSIPFLVLNGVWTIVSIRDLFEGSSRGNDSSGKKDSSKNNSKKWDLTIWRNKGEFQLSPLKKDF